MMTTATTIDPEQRMLGEVEMVGRDRWEAIHRRAGAGGSVRAIARELDLDRKTVRRCLRQTEWKAYRRAARADTLLTAHAEYLRRRAAEVGYSAQVLFQELRGREYDGSYETVKRFVRPLREAQLHAAVTRTRFETPPGLQSQIDWGQARVRLADQLEVRHPPPPGRCPGRPRDSPTRSGSFGGRAVHADGALLVWIHCQARMWAGAPQRLGRASPRGAGAAAAGEHADERTDDDLRTAIHIKLPTALRQQPFSAGWRARHVAR